MEAITNSKSQLTYTFKIEGMTCGKCITKITELLRENVIGASSIKVSLRDKKVDITANREITLREVQLTLAELTKYKVDYYDDVKLATALPQVEKKSFFQTYKPLFTVFAYILIFSTAFQVSMGSFSAHHFMNHLMAGFFIGLSFFKFLDLKSFATAFSNYDPLAKRWTTYGLIYPFIELALGFLFIADKFLPLANITTILILGISTIGVYQKIKSKSQFQCACLGAGFNIPLSYITVFENLAMVAMALVGIFAPF